MSGNMSSSSSEVIPDDLQMRLDYLENRVAFARLLFPTEARLAMESADADSTSVYIGLLASKSKGSCGNLKEVDLNETPSMRIKRLQTRLQALRKTVETGRRYFPHCSAVLDNYLDDMPDVRYLERGTSEEQEVKKMRFMELKDEVQKAFYKDMAENSRPGLTSSSLSSSTLKEGMNHEVRRK
ncbi:regulatory protein NPR3-like [Tripterygium wilfordii]|uniref:Regulatory protein NPR3-like n=1 Tax=Tripterygium wilfordii TaxID=458696 RepID=A0A7J7CBV5_TRIWF|nr:BTB/POZ domain and ankyrin repeat-containing protein NPR1-like [Tripterygium wilfordii]XP_038683734.1 BTB/POZ domain and ankyrin repeat-containing protein NPR1-like [Tripterygium wilfordii]KAF5731347.1 regulatory protein NPR3-like [Tripterygium wilfordii]